MTNEQLKQIQEDARVEGIERAMKERFGRIHKKSQDAIGWNSRETCSVTVSEIQKWLDEITQLLGAL